MRRPGLEFQSVPDLGMRRGSVDEISRVTRATTGTTHSIIRASPGRELETQAQNEISISRMVYLQGRKIEVIGGYHHLYNG